MQRPIKEGKFEAMAFFLSFIFIVVFVFVFVFLFLNTHNDQVKLTAMLALPPRRFSPVFNLYIYIFNPSLGCCPLSISYNVSTLTLGNDSIFISNHTSPFHAFSQKMNRLRLLYG